MRAGGILDGAWQESTGVLLLETAASWTSTIMTVEGLEELFQQTWFDHLLHYGLLVGAIFQLICIAAIVVLPPKTEEEAGEEVPPSAVDGGGPKDSQNGGGEDSGVHTQVAKGGVSKKSKKVRKRK